MSVVEFGQRMANCSQEGALGQRDKGPFFPYRRLDLGALPTRAAILGEW
jgi:hypothetical protein